MDFGNRDRGVAWISREAKDSIDCAGSFGRADSVNFLVDCSIFVLQLSVRSFTDLRNTLIMRREPIVIFHPCNVQGMWFLGYRKEAMRLWIQGRTFLRHSGPPYSQFNDFKYWWECRPWRT